MDFIHIPITYKYIFIYRYVKYLYQYMCSVWQKWVYSHECVKHSLLSYRYPPVTGLFSTQLQNYFCRTLYLPSFCLSPSPHSQFQEDGHCVRPSRPPLCPGTRYRPGVV